MCIGVRSGQRSDHGYGGGAFCGMAMCLSFLFSSFLFLRVSGQPSEWATRC